MILDRDIRRKGWMRVSSLWYGARRKIVVLDSDIGCKGWMRVSSLRNGTRRKIVILDSDIGRKGRMGVTGRGNRCCCPRVVTVVVGCRVNTWLLLRGCRNRCGVGIGIERGIVVVVGSSRCCVVIGHRHSDTRRKGVMGGGNTRIKRWMGLGWCGDRVVVVVVVGCSRTRRRRRR